eukprot:GFUD01003456.1.p1 GENE.GFUD01003456.1~~GFUD01003456.1.p1  ORF type:complete len:309 (+),score=68.17 GFUD01003456.1:41-967(+)
MASSSPRKIPSNSSLLDPSCGIPTDVTFQIMGFKTPDLETGQDKEILLGEVKGHKLILGMVSTVYKAGFYGPAKETKDIVPVRQTTLEAFKKMVDYIYSKEIDWSGQTVLEMYDVVNLAERYDIPGLLEEIQTQMEKVPLTMENVMEVADTAFQFSQFPTVSDQLLLNCAKYVKKTLKTPASLVQFATDGSGSGQEATVLKLLALIRTITPPIPNRPNCPNCKQDQCQHGKLVESLDKIVLGCKLAENNRVQQYYDDREKRRLQLEGEMAKIGLAEEAQEQMRKILSQKESNYRALCCASCLQIRHGN